MIKMKTRYPQHNIGAYEPEQSRLSQHSRHIRSPETTCTRSRNLKNDIFDLYIVEERGMLTC